MDAEPTKRNGRLPIMAAGGVFVLCAAVVTIGLFQHDAGNTVLQFLILAGIVLTFIDRHLRQQEIVGKVDDNTKLTAEVKQEAKSLNENAANLDSTLKKNEETAKVAGEQAATKVAARAMVKAEEVATKAAAKTDAVAEQTATAMREIKQSTGNIEKSLNGALDDKIKGIVDKAVAPIHANMQEIRLVLAELRGKSPAVVPIVVPVAAGVPDEVLKKLDEHEAKIKENADAERRHHMNNLLAGPAEKARLLVKLEEFDKLSVDEQVRVYGPELRAELLTKLKELRAEQQESKP